MKIYYTHKNSRLNYFIAQILLCTDKKLLCRNQFINIPNFQVLLLHIFTSLMQINYLNFYFHQIINYIHFKVSRYQKERKKERKKFISNTKKIKKTQMSFIKKKVF